MPLPEGRETLVVEHVWLVKSNAKKICNLLDCHPLFEELTQEGTIGLLKAVDRYDPNAGVKLATYAYSWIRGAMFNYLDKNGKYGIKISRLLRNRARKIVLTHDELMRRLNRKPTPVEIAETAGLTINEVEEGLDLLAMSLVDLADISDVGQGSFDPSNRERSPEETTIKRGQIEAVLEALRQLSADRRRVLMLRYGEDLSNRETAEKMGKTEGAVKVLVHRALEDLRKLLVTGQAEENPNKDSGHCNDGGDKDAGN